MKIERRQLFLNLLAVVSTAFCVQAQNINNFNSNWVFGNAIHLGFSPTPSPITPVLNTLVTHDMENSEGNASISDGFGNLLFYVGHPSTNPAAFNLYDGNYNVMPNGQNLVSHESASQGIVIVRDPEDCTEYYVFYVSNSAGNGLRYSKVDMDLNGGMGDVIATEKDILLYNTRGEKVIIAQKENSKYFWVITRRIDPAAGPLDELVAIELQPGGVFASPVISIFSAPAASPGTGYMNMRSDNQKLADVQYATKQVNTYDFNAASGVFTNRTTIYNSADNLPYGGCYSPNGNVFYVTFQNNTPGPGMGDEILRRYDLLNSPTGTIYTDLSVGLSDGFHSIQRSTKGLLYMTQGSSLFMHVVNEPNNYSAPNIILNGLATTGLLLGGVPNEYFSWENYTDSEFLNINGSQEVCFNTSAVLGGTADSIEAVYSWQGQISTPSGWSTPSSSFLVNPNVTNPTTINLTSGTYRFILSILTECGDTIVEGKEFVMLDSLSTPVVSGNLDYCNGETITALTSTPALLGNINWYSDAGLTNLLATGTSFTPSNTVGATTYYVVEQLSGGLVPGTCTGFVTTVTVNINPQAALCYTKQAAKWYMGNNIGLNFLCSSPPSILSGSAANVSLMEGGTSISDVNGNLLFYSYDGIVYDRNNNVMLNGAGLNFDFSSSQGAIAVQNITNPNKYYLLYVMSAQGGMYYSEIDMTLNAGLGAVEPLTKNTLLLNGVGEQITGVENCQGTGTWIIVHDANNMYAYLISASGISAPVTSPIPTVPTNSGQLSASPTGRHIAYSTYNLGTDLFTFDNETGKICYKESLSFGGYGNCFSNSGRFLYVQDMFAGLYQYDVYTTGTINSTEVFIDLPYIFGTLHLAPDCKIYTFGITQTFGSVINNPDSPGLSCNFQAFTFPLSTTGGVSQFGGPNYIQSWFKDPTYVEPTIDADFTFAGTCPSLPVSFTNASTVITECPRYSWDFGDPVSGSDNTSTDENPTHLFSAPGTYTVSLTVEERCQSNTQTYVVTVSVPNVTITGDTIVCITDNISLTASGGTTYSWTGPSWHPGGVTSSTATVTNQGDPMMGGDNEGWYYVTVTDNGCSTTDSVYVYILQSPDVTITQSVGTCGTTLNSVINYSNGPVSTYTWTLGGAPPVLGTGSSVFVSPTAITEYVVFVIDSAGCGAGGLTWVDPVEPPAAPVASVTTAPSCTVTTATITVSSPVGGNYQYSIDGGTTWQSSTVFSGLSASSSVTVTAQDMSTNCVSAGTLVIIPSVSGSLDIPSITITPATCSSPSIATISNYDSGQTYTFTPVGPGIGVSGVISGLSVGTSYSVVASYGSCTSTSSASFSISDQLDSPSAPTASVTTAPSCSEPTGTVTVSDPLGPNYQYSIDGGTTWQASAVISGLAASGSVTIIVQDISTGCVSSGMSVSIPAIAGTPSEPVGISQNPTCILMGVITLSSPTGGDYEYSIDGGLTWQSSPVFSGLTAQTYSVIVQDVNTGCQSAGTDFILDAPVGPDVTVSSDAIFTSGESVSLTASGAVDYSWSPGTYLDFTTGSTVIATPDQSMIYCVVGTDTNGCTDTACVMLTMEIECTNLFVPNVFSPNENSKDDELCVLGADCINNLQFRLYNRWGELIFETTNPSVCWDGKFRGEYVSSGSYAYTIEGVNVNGEKIKREGTITVLR